MCWLVDNLNSTTSVFVINDIWMNCVYLSFQCLLSWQESIWSDPSQCGLSRSDLSRRDSSRLYSNFCAHIFQLQNNSRAQSFLMLSHPCFLLVAESCHRGALLLDKSKATVKNNSKLPCIITCGQFLPMVTGGFVPMASSLLRPNPPLHASVRLSRLLRWVLLSMCFHM